MNKDDPQITSPMIIAHRGSSKESPENTLSAFQLAISQGADGIEGDFHLTKDKQVVCIHDSNTARVANTKLIVKNSTLAELKKLDVGYWFNSTFKNEKIPTLNEVLEILPSDKKLFLEIKSDPDIVPYLLSILIDSKINLNQLVIISFNSRILRTIKQQKPELKTLFLVSFKTFNRIKLSNFLVKKLLNKLEDISADGISTSISNFLNETYIHQFISKGYEYHLWTIDNEKIAEQFIKIGVNSITTNTPKIIKQIKYFQTKS
ncbi:glycerophosphodiester phosphodiesterase [Cyanobacterium aponinum AL20118]|uniref:Glycerophosphodiester phosphodiesterase n=1 Tax=Cyanobacterium aponinum AL20115 TaxID=3090662 RepID=A0AAF0Z9V2_9CHRO|nr:glycerophosphodiester phosphodiesterase [Cyanobacterium aponinum]WPF89071.1 glycerophosphodiester phosphodiesterase [Cyanobacterium aponinum AL20115]